MLVLLDITGNTTFFGQRLGMRPLMLSSLHLYKFILLPTSILPSKFNQSIEKIIPLLYLKATVKVLYFREYSKVWPNDNYYKQRLMKTQSPSLPIDHGHQLECQP